MTDVMLPPHDVGAEAAVISSILLDGKTIDLVSDTIRPDHFFLDAHRWICEAAYSLAAAGVPVDIVTVAKWLREHDRLGQIGGTPTLAELTDAVPFVANIGAYAEIVAKKAAVRRMIAACQRIAADGYGAAGTVDEYLIAAASTVESVARESNGGKARDIFSEREIFADVARSMINGKPAKRCTSGIADLDEDLGGYFSGFVTWFGAETHWGKSSFAVLTYESLVRAGKRVLLISCEDSRELFARRILARRANVSAYYLRDHLLTDHAFSRVLGVANEATSDPFFLEAIGMRAEAIAARIRHLCSREPFDLVIVDYLQAISAGRKTQDKRNEMTFIARTLTDAIKSSETAGLVFSQLRRLEPGRIPTRNDLKESGDVENMAENVFLGHTKQGVKLLRVAKAKDGPKREYEMEWNATSCSFSGARRTEGDVIQ